MKCKGTTFFFIIAQNKQKNVIFAKNYFKTLFVEIYKFLIYKILISMKTKIGIGLLLLFCNIVLAQNNCKCKKDSIRYATAYNYIVKDSKYKIWVSDSICDLNSSVFYSDLKDYPKIKEKMQQYWIDKDFIPFKPFYSSCIASIFKKKESAADNMLFFINKR